MSVEIGNKVTGHVDNHRGRVEFAGVVSNVYRSGGDTLVNVDDSNGDTWTTVLGKVTVVTVPEPVPTEKSEPNVRTHTGMVHAPGKAFKGLRGQVAPKCCASASAVSRFHFIVPTSDPVTCKRCIASLAR